MSFLGNADMASRIVRSLICATIIACWPLLDAPPVRACEIGSRLTRETVEAAVTMFRGQLVEYEVIKGNAVKLRFVVTETYRGQKRDEWSLLWVNSTFGVPKDLEAFLEGKANDLVVGVTT